MKKSLAAVGLVGVSAIALAGCAGGSGSDTDGDAEIRVWLVGTDPPQDARG